MLTLLLLLGLFFASEGIAQAIRPYLREVVCARVDSPNCRARAVADLAEPVDEESDVIGRMVTKAWSWTERTANRVVLEIRRIYRAAYGRSDLRGPARVDECPPALCPREERLPPGPIAPRGPRDDPLRVPAPVALVALVA